MRDKSIGGRSSSGVLQQAKALSAAPGGENATAPTAWKIQFRGGLFPMRWRALPEVPVRKPHEG